MKKKITSIFIFAILAALLSACGKTDNPKIPPTTGDTLSTEASVPTSSEPQATQQVISTDSVLLSVLTNTQPIFTEFGLQQTLCDYLAENYSAVPIAFTLLDMDQDGRNEMVVETDSYVATYVLLHLEQDVVYAFPFGVRQLGKLKADGSFSGSNSAFNSLYMTMDFADGSFTCTTIAECEYYEGWFTIHGESCTQEEFEEFASCWEASPSASWISLAVPAESQLTTPPTEAPSVNTDTPYLEKIGRADQPIFAGPGYDYAYVATVEIAGIYTIMEEQWDYEGNLWGRLKSGIGWVDLTDIRGSQPLVTVSLLDQTLINSGNYHHCVGETSDYLIQCVFRVSANVTNIRIYNMVFDGMELVPDRLLYTLDQLTPDKPLVADISLPGDMSVCGFYCTDETGAEREFAVSTSGRNGMLTIVEAKPK